MGFVQLSGKLSPLNCLFLAEVHFQNWKAKKCFAFKEVSLSKLSICVENEDSGGCSCGLKLNMKWGVVSPRRCWALLWSGAACQPWSRNCFDAAVFSSTALPWACSSCPPPSALTRAPRGQIFSLKETCFDFHQTSLLISEFSVTEMNVKWFVLSFNLFQTAQKTSLFFCFNR